MLWSAIITSSRFVWVFYSVVCSALPPPSQVWGQPAQVNWLSWLEGPSRNSLQPKNSSAAWGPTWCTAVRSERDRYVSPYGDAFSVTCLSIHSFIHSWKNTKLLVDAIPVSSQAAKICNNMLLAIGMIGTSETMNLGIRWPSSTVIICQAVAVELVLVTWTFCSQTRSWS